MWEALSVPDKRQIIHHLEHFGVLKEGQQIVGDINTPMPAIDCHGCDRNGKGVQALGVDWVCRAICNSSGEKTNCALYGQSLHLCMETISKSRQVYFEELAES